MRARVYPRWGGRERKKRGKKETLHRERERERERERKRDCDNLNLKGQKSLNSATRTVSIIPLSIYVHGSGRREDVIYAETMLVGISRRVHDQSATVESVDRSADWSASSGVPRDSAFRDASMSCARRWPPYRGRYPWTRPESCCVYVRVYVHGSQHTRRRAVPGHGCIGARVG